MACGQEEGEARGGFRDSRAAESGSGVESGTGWGWGQLRSRAFLTRRVSVPGRPGLGWGPGAFASPPWRYTWLSEWTFLRQPVHLLVPGLSWPLRRF